MVFDRYSIPAQLQKGPAVGFLILTDVLAELGVADLRPTSDWRTVEQKLRELDTALSEYLALEDLDHAVALEFIIHRDRVAHILDSWKNGVVHDVERAVLVYHEHYMRERQQAAREHSRGEDRDSREE